jgi:hypothetical protein
MHRSGTSLIARLLRTVGGYYGTYLTENSEPKIFQRFNDYILSRIGYSWNTVDSNYDSTYLLNDSMTLRNILNNQNMLWKEFFQNFGHNGMEKKSFRKKPFSYLSLHELLLNKKFPTPTQTAPFWGWKDPRTTLTLTLWLKLFPKSRIIHVIRNGIDSALSLWRRCIEKGDGAPQCNDLIYCFDLWERYVEEGLKWRIFPNHRYHEVRYENILYDPRTYLSDLFSFIDVPLSETAALYESIDSTKLNCNHWEAYPELAEHAAKSRIFQELGYTVDIAGSRSFCK